MQTLQKLSHRLFYLSPYSKTDRPILAAIVGDNQTLLIDAGNSTSHAKLFKEQLASYHIKGDLLALTHWHWDHVFGLKEMDMTSIANVITCEKIKELQHFSWEDSDLDNRVEAGIEIPFCADAIKLELGENRDINISTPSIIYENQLKLNLGGVSCIIEHVGGDHSIDSSIIFIEEEKALFLGDCLYANMYAEKWHYTVQKICKLLEKIESYNAQTYFLSHHPAPLTKDEFNNFSTLLKTSARLAEKYNGNLEMMKTTMETSFQRELSEEDVEIMTYFANGYSFKNQ